MRLLSVAEFVRRIGSITPRALRGKVQLFSANLDWEGFQRLAHKYVNAPHPDLALRQIASLGLKPNLIVDVGAYEGNWARNAKSIWPTSSILMLEANMQKSSKLAQVAAELGAEYQSALLGSSDGRPKEFYVMETGSSVLEERSDVSRSKQVLTEVTLDSLLNGRKVDFLKIDVQGYELEVLRGSIGALENVEAILLELSLIDINAGAPLFHEVIGFLAERGFVAYDIVEFHRRAADRVLWQIDVVFVPISSALRSNRTLTRPGIAE